jgi:hypothetical protein
MSFTTAQLDAFWARYVTMRQGDVITVSRDEPPVRRDALLCDAEQIVWVQRLHGFADFS